MPRESKAHKRRRAEEINRRLANEYPRAECSLDYDNPFQLLVATILAAQCTDARVNQITPELFEQYPSPENLAAAGREDIEELIRSCGFYRNKAKSIQGAAARIVDEHDGEVPDTMPELLALPGVARKTANVILGTAFGKNEGVVVDTHVTRLAGRLNLTARKNNQGDKIEKDLQSLLPQEEWTMFAHRLVFHGRQCCTARKPDCERCCLNDLCPSAGKV
jgi:endonuclease-3